MRLIVCTQLEVCRAAKVKWPVSDKVTPAWVSLFYFTYQNTIRLPPQDVLSAAWKLCVSGPPPVGYSGIACCDGECQWGIFYGDNVVLAILIDVVHHGG